MSFSHSQTQPENAEYERGFLVWLVNQTPEDEIYGWKVLQYEVDNHSTTSTANEETPPKQTPVFR